jgi:hypothetical protein
MVLFMSPPTHQLVNLFPPNPNDPHSGRTTPSSVAAATSGRSSALNVESSGAIFLNMQPDLSNATHPIACQGSLSVLNLDMLAAEKPSGREKGSSAYSAVEHCSQ